MTEKQERTLNKVDIPQFQQLPSIKYRILEGLPDCIINRME